MSLPLRALAAVGAGVIALASPAHATWRVAETEHFIYYSEAPPADVVAAATRMETFDKLVRAFTGNARPPSPVKVTMFEVADMDEVNRTFPYPSSSVGGYYNSTSSGPFLVTFRDRVEVNERSIRKTTRRSFDWGSEVRQHEYLHHYMYQYFNANYPTWYSEGFAEYYGSMVFPEPNVVEIGHAPYYRMDTINSGGWLPLAKLLTAKSYSDIDDVGQLYAQGWLLTHYGAQNKPRGMQLQQYLKAVATGTAYDKAAKDAFGDLGVLDRELRDHKKDIQATRLSLKPMDFGVVPVRELSEMESQLMRYRIRLYSGMEVAALGRIATAIADIRKAAPDNVMGLEIQAQVDNLGRRHSAALTHAEHLLRVDPGNAVGLTEKGRAMAGLLDKSAPMDRWEAARAPLRQAIGLSKIAIAPRVALFKSFAAQGIQPSLEAQNRLVEAFQLLPQNDEIRYLLARDFEERGLIDDAIAIIGPSAFGSFDGDEKEKAKRGKLLAQYAAKYTNIDNYEPAGDMMARLQAKKTGRWDAAKGVIVADPAAKAS